MVLPALAETYAPRCDGYMVASNWTELSLGAVHLSHRGPEDYSTIWQKVRSMWMYVHKHYLDDFDFFHIGGDHMWVVVENLKYALSHENASEPLYLGAPFIRGTLLKRMFCGGGAGYTLCLKAL
jgi:glycoprotein-N-acetylgalactosamine 3-beta-galactosyltransferase